MMSLRVIDSSFGSIRKTIRFSLSVPTARPSPEAFRLLSNSSERINTLGRRRAPSYADSVRGEDRISAARMSAAVPQVASVKHVPAGRDGEFIMEDSQRRRSRDFVIFVIVAYQARPRPMDRRVLVPIETGCLVPRAAIVASNLMFALGGDRYVAASLTLIALAVTVMVVRWQVLEIIGPKPTPSMLGSRSKIG